jgi:hypothetical protein
MDQEIIAYARDGGVTTTLSERSREVAQQRRWMMPGTLALVAYVVAMRAPGPGGLKFLGLILVSAAWVTVLRLRLPPKAMIERWSGVPFHPDRGARVACTGSPEDLARLERLGPVDPEAFEPYIVRAANPMPSPRQRLANLAAFAGAMGAGVVFGLSEVGRGFSVAAPVFMVGTAMAIATVSSRLWPVYLRVSPGRLDVVRFDLWGRAVGGVERHDLRSSAVLVDIGQSCVFIARGGVTRDVAFGGVRDRHALAHAVLRGALCRAETPPLPDDSLVG